MFITLHFIQFDRMNRSFVVGVHRNRFVSIAITKSIQFDLDSSASTANRFKIMNHYHVASCRSQSEPILTPHWRICSAHNHANRRRKCLDRNYFHRNTNKQVSRVGLIETIDSSELVLYQQRPLYNECVTISHLCEKHSSGSNKEY